MAGSRTVRRWSLAGTLVAAGVLASGCSATDLPRFGWPEGVTDQAKRMQGFWSGSVIAALVVGVIVWGLMFWSFIAYRKRKNSPLYPKQTKENLPLELVYTAAPFVLIAVLFYFTVTTENFVLKTVPNPDVNVNVTAFKWGWDFSYDGTDMPAQNTTAQQVETDNKVHTVSEPTEVPILVLPVNKVIQYTLSSRDVIHSFWVPDFLFKRDVFPYPQQNNSVNVFQNTIQTTGAFVGRCAELCGTYHSAMNFEVRSVPDDVYQAYLKYRQQIDPATQQPYTFGAALAQVGKDIPSCGQLCSPRSYTTYPIDPNRAAKQASQPQAGGK
ncbi:aa3-type cytochrome oxidase subunit II [Nakamurella endophytica]|uniref:aa3-type cytochrome oxidase subunit II n=1 Tax=Nakamurella endophytica TaxID=1748367 RepID=UPI001E43157B|nr:cytochrome c oxidase subunit II [Nakamurella endophytica]